MRHHNLRVSGTNPLARPGPIYRGAHFLFSSLGIWERDGDAIYGRAGAAILVRS